MWTWRRIEVTGGFLAAPLVGIWLGAGPILPVLYVSALCHELGHLAALRLAGVKAERIRLTGVGAEILADTRYLGYGREILCCLAGPAVNLALAFCFSRMRGYDLIAGANLLLGAYNLLPASGLDGGQVLWLGVSWLWGPWAADRFCLWVGVGTALLLSTGASVLFFQYHSGFFLVLAGIRLLLSQGFPVKTGL